MISNQWSVLVLLIHRATEHRPTRWGAFKSAKNPLASVTTANIYSIMVTDIIIALVYVSIFFALGGIAFVYLLKGKN